MVQLKPPPSSDPLSDTRPPPEVVASERGPASMEAEASPLPSLPAASFPPSRVTHCPTVVSADVQTSPAGQLLPP